VLESEQICAILESSETDRNKKAEKIRSTLRERRFPALNAAENRYAEMVKTFELGNPNAIKLIPPPFFEGTEYTLTLSFKNLKELEARRSALNLLAKNETFRSYFDLP
jgi:hypothetical protein